MSIRGQRVAVQRQRWEQPPQVRNKLRLLAKAAIHNRFDIVVRHADGNEDRAVAYNIVLDALWTRLSTSWNWFKAIAYGSGTGTLSASRADLFTRISAKTAGTLVEDWSHFDEGYVSFRQQIQIPAGELTGSTLREVGIAYDTSANHLLTHAQLRDMNGNVVAITIGALDVINIYATVFVRFNPAGYMGGGLRYTRNSGICSFVRIFGGVESTSLSTAFATLRAYSGRAPMLLIQAETSPDIGYISSKTPVAAYVSGTKTVTVKCSLAAGTRIGVSDLNPTDPGGINGITFGGAAANANKNAGIIADFPNTAKQYSTITDESVGVGDGVTRDYPTAFGLILNDGSAALKVNGTAVPPGDYTIDYGKPAHQKIGMFLKPIDGNYNFPLTNTTVSTVAGSYEVLENPFYTTYGITSFYAISNVMVECSNDLSNWTTIKTAATSAGTINVNATYQKYRYWRVSTPSAVTSTNAFKDIMSTDIPTATVHFAAGKAPAAGALPTLSYHTASIPKDSNHVVDLELTVQLGEYVA